MGAVTDFSAVAGDSVAKDVEKNSINILKTYSVVIDGDEAGTTAQTIVVNLADAGMTKFEGIRGWAHTTKDSVVAVEEPTTIVTAGVLTITQKVAGTAAKQKVYQIFGT